MKLTRPVVLVAAAFTAVGAFAIAQQPSTKTPPAKPAAAQPEKPSMPGMSEADMKACMDAATPGPNHELLTRSVGTYTVKSSMWMGEGAEPMTAEAKATITSVMDGKFTRWETVGDVPGMGEMKGSGTYGYDNAGKQFQACWITSCGTGMMIGTGEASEGGKTMTWTYTYNCPIAKKPIKMRDVEKHPDADTIVVTTFGPDPKSGKEYRMVEMTMKREGKGTEKAAR
jgi:hypothetical protein